MKYCKTHYYRAPFNFTHFAQGDDDAYITGADIRSKIITMPNLEVIQLMCVIIWPRSDSSQKLRIGGYIFMGSFSPVLHGIQTHAMHPVIVHGLISPLTS